MVGERTSTPEEGPAVGAVSVATQVAAGRTDVVQQLAGASIRKFSDPLPVSTTARPFEIGQAGHGAMPTQQLEELCVVVDSAARSAMVSTLHPSAATRSSNYWRVRVGACASRPRAAGTLPRSQMPIWPALKSAATASLSWLSPRSSRTARPAIGLVSGRDQDDVTGVVGVAGSMEEVEVGTHLGRSR